MWGTLLVMALVGSLVSCAPMTNRLELLNDQLAETNRKLSSANSKLSEANKKITTTNKHLENVQAKLHDANQKLETAEQAVAKIPGGIAGTVIEPECKGDSTGATTLKSYPRGISAIGAFPPH
jgi:peptidoglycan hydrolase CwlO-like protein